MHNMSRSARAAGRGAGDPEEPTRPAAIRRPWLACFPKRSGPGIDGHNKMRTDKQITRSRANGARFCGPYSTRAIAHRGGESRAFDRCFEIALLWPGSAPPNGTLISTYRSLKPGEKPRPKPTETRPKPEKTPSSASGTRAAAQSHRCTFRHFISDSAASRHLALTRTEPCDRLPTLRVSRTPQVCPLTGSGDPAPKPIFKESFS
jgi:hypothetical protein